MKDIPSANQLNAHENVFAFGSHLASMEVLQMLSLILAPGEIADVGHQMFHFVLGSMSVSRSECYENCFFQTIVGKGDYSGIEICGIHEIAKTARNERNEKYKNL
jgi:hypothetical protein